MTFFSIEYVRFICDTLLTASLIEALKEEPRLSNLT